MSESARRLRQFAERVRDEPIFLAASLEQIRRRRGWTDAELAAHLGGDEDQLARLRLCRPPRADRWVADVAQIAAHCGVEADRLAGLLRAAPPGELPPGASGGSGGRNPRGGARPDQRGGHRQGAGAGPSPYRWRTGAEPARCPTRATRLPRWPVPTVRRHRRLALASGPQRFDPASPHAR